MISALISHRIYPGSRPGFSSRLVAAAIGSLTLAACGASTPATEAPEAEAAQPAATETAPKGETSSGPAKPAVDDTTVPSSCETKDDLCAPSKAFVKRLCGGVHPDVALSMFAKGTPFTRGYMRMNVDAWNASGGASSQGKLVFDEEVLLLLLRKNETGIAVSGASGSYDVLRWDGTCATLSAEEVTTSVAPKPKAASIVWKDLAEATQEALLGDEKIAQINKDRRKECKGASMGEVSKKCVKLVDQLSDAVVAHVRGGGQVPAPAKIK